MFLFQNDIGGPVFDNNEFVRIIKNDRGNRGAIEVISEDDYTQLKGRCEEYMLSMIKYNFIFIWSILETVFTRMVTP